MYRPFALNGFELGAYPAAELAPMPDDVTADRLRRREMLYALRELLDAHGEDAMPVDAFSMAVYGSRRYTKEQAVRRRRRLDALTRAYDRVKETEPE